MDGAGGRARGGARGGEARGDRPALAGLRRARRGARARRTRRSTTRASRRRQRRSRRGSNAISSGASPASGRISTTSRSAAGDRELRSFGSQGEQRLAVLSLLLAEAEVIARAARHASARPARRRPLGARRDRRRALARADRPGRADGRHGDRRRRAPARAGAAARGDARPGDGALMERLGGQVRKELGRVRARGRRHGRDRAGVAGGGRATRSRGTRGRRGSPATGRCTSTPSRRPGRSSSAGSPDEILEQLRAGARRRDAAGAQVRSGARARRGRGAAGAAGRAAAARWRRSTARRAPRSPPRSTTTSCASTSREPPRQASPRLRRGPVRPPFLIHCNPPARWLFAGLF